MEGTGREKIGGRSKGKEIRKQNGGEGAAERQSDWCSEAMLKLAASSSLMSREADRRYVKAVYKRVFRG